MPGSFIPIHPELLRNNLTNQINEIQKLKKLISEEINTGPALCYLNTKYKTFVINYAMLIFNVSQNQIVTTCHFATPIATGSFTQIRH